MSLFVFLPVSVAALFWVRPSSALWGVETVLLGTVGVGIAVVLTVGVRCTVDLVMDISESLKIELLSILMSDSSDSLKKSLTSVFSVKEILVSVDGKKVARVSDLMGIKSEREGNKEGDASSLHLGRDSIGVLF
jgi:hypothetical protein